MALSTKTMLFVCLFVAAVAVVPAAAQLINLGNILGPIIGLTRIEGLLFCSVNGTATVGPGGIILTPPFANATVQLRCGAGNGNVVASVQTTSQGAYSILLDSLSFTLAQILSGCRLVVATPLVNCNATLPATGTLTSTLTSLGNTILGTIPTNIVVPIQLTLSL